MAKRVRVYWNSHRDCYSIQGKGSGRWRVIDHWANDRVALSLTDVALHVVQGGRQRVLDSKKKNVHAWLEGDLRDRHAPVDIPLDWTQVSYNPYKSHYFITPEGKPVLWSKHALVCWMDGQPYIYVEDK